MFLSGPTQIQLPIHDIMSTFANPSGSLKGWAEEGFTEPFWRWKRSWASLAAVGRLGQGAFNIGSGVPGRSEGTGGEL